MPPPEGKVRCVDASANPTLCRNCDGSAQKLTVIDRQLLRVNLSQKTIGGLCVLTACEA